MVDMHILYLFICIRNQIRWWWYIERLYIDISIGICILLHDQNYYVIKDGITFAGRSKLGIYIAKLKMVYLNLMVFMVFCVIQPAPITTCTKNNSSLLGCIYLE